MANLGAILKALATWQPTGPISRDQLAQGMGRSSVYANFDRLGQKAPVVNADVQEPQQASMGQAPQVQPFTPPPLPEGQPLPALEGSNLQALAAALNQNMGSSAPVMPWAQNFQSPQAPGAWAGMPSAQVSVGGQGGGAIDGQSWMSPQPSYNTFFDESGAIAGRSNTEADEEDMMRRSREYQDMVLNLLARARGNG